MVSELTARQRDFWELFAARLPKLAARMERGNESSRWLAVGPRPYVIGHFYADKAAGIFIRGPRGVRTALIREELFPYREFMAKALGQPEIRLGTYFLLVSGHRTDMLDRSNWPGAVDWFAEMSPVYEKALTELQSRWNPAWPE